MILVNLPFPVILETSLKEVSKTLSVDLEHINKCFRYANYLCLYCGEPLFLNEQAYLDVMAIKDETERAKYEFPPYSMGSEAILWYAEKLGKEIPFIDKIFISNQVWLETRHEWDHICNLVNRVETRVNRYKRLMEIGTPDIITRNEKRMLCEAIWSLDDNTDNHISWSDGEHVISLKEVGWSLLTQSWEPWKQRKIEERDAALYEEYSFEEEMEDEESE